VTTDPNNPARGEDGTAHARNQGNGEFLSASGFFKSRRSEYGVGSQDGKTAQVDGHGALTQCRMQREQGGSMNCRTSVKLIPGLLLSIALAGPAFAGTATQSMKDAGHSAENAVSHAWHGTKTAIKDTDVTAKVKMALHNDKLTRGRDIHVDTNDGVVTLTGYAPEAAAHRAAVVARDTTGVVGVNNNIRVNESMSAR
jgi:hypothetical protein